MAITDLFSSLFTTSTFYMEDGTPPPAKEEAEEPASKDDGAAEEEPAEEPEAKEEEEEDEPEDPLPEIRESCKESKECSGFSKHFEHCTEKVTAGKGFKGEDCVEEFMMHCVDNCVAPKLFSKLR